MRYRKIVKAVFSVDNADSYVPKNYFKISAHKLNIALKKLAESKLK
jgi:hypothetical protein